MPTGQERNVTVAGRHLHRPRHICCFFDSPEQEYEVLTPYYREGIENGEKVLTIKDGALLAEHRRRLEENGLTFDRKARRHFCSLRSDDTYLDGGTFDKRRMYERLEQELTGIPASGFTALRTCGDMRWALRNLPGTEALLEYESEINALLETHDATFMCSYDANQVTGQALLDILCTHTHVLIGTVVHENPYFMDPAVYRATALARRKTPSLLSLSAGRADGSGTGSSPSWA